MKANAFIILTGFTVLIACNDQNNSTTTTTLSADTVKSTPVASAPATPGGWCFAQQNARDTFQLNLKREGETVSGTLVYLFKEKDNNRGQISGTMRGDTLIADYTFNAEGLSSTRQVAFLIQADKATEGYGDLEEKNGKMVFKDLSGLSFGKGIVMNKVDCK